MWKQLYDLVINFATLAKKVEKQEQALKDQQQELRELPEFTQRLAFELQRVKDDQQRSAEREAYERRVFQLEVENQLLKSRQLPPRTDDKRDEEGG
jgi:hypothetical protein